MKKKMVISFIALPTSMPLSIKNMRRDIRSQFLITLLTSLGSFITPDICFQCWGEKGECKLIWYLFLKLEYDKLL